VGDSPIIGAGLYANELAGTSCTGKGEQILRVVMARMAVLHVENGLNVDQAVEAVMRELREKTSGEAGLILADSSGNVSFGFDTPHMPIAIGSLDKDDVYSSMVPKIADFRSF
jgi:beta-aspartyl-peptidase (threonine type)